MGWPGCMIGQCNLVTNCQLFSIYQNVYYFTFPSAPYEGSRCFTSLPILDMVSLFQYSNRCVGVSHYSWNLNFAKTSWRCLFSFFLISQTRDLSILWSSQKRSWLHWLYCFLFSISFIYTLVFIISFLLLSLGFIYFFFSSFLRW